ncbi:unnamed protein product [Echinostoma caproni]|uniref:Transducin/WD40 repeat-like superfamily protein n=1 Tax=Echinostoma caproni TaxID=27848 RepID=A0A183B0H4_9TREM|nr:unnamed protein product [Echinostoma caproni]
MFISACSADPTKPCQITSTRAVNGLTVDPLCNNRIASFFERQVSIWKVDSLEKPVSYWASGRPNCPLLAFSWHPSLPNCLLTLDREGCLDIAELIERPATAWSPEQALLWSHSGQWTAYDPWSVKSSRVIQLMSPPKPMRPSGAIADQPHEPEDPAAVGDELGEPTLATSIARRSSMVVELQQHLLNDIASVMRRRAELGYGMGLDPELYINILGETTSLGTMWRWIKCILFVHVDGSW